MRPPINVNISVACSMVCRTPCLPYLGVHTVSTKASGPGGRSRRIGGLLHETGERQLRHVSNIGVGETTITASMAAMRCSKISRFSTGKPRAAPITPQLIIGQRNHAPDDNPGNSYSKNERPRLDRGTTGTLPRTMRAFLSKPHALQLWANTPARGKIILISVNSPGCVSTSIDPPCCLTMMS